MNDTDVHPLSVRRIFKQRKMPARSCSKCLRRVVYVVSWTPLCRKHALEEFTQNLYAYMKDAS